MELSLSFMSIALTIYLLVSLYKLFSSLSPQSAPLPPGPTPLPIIGNLLDLDRQPHRALARLAKTYGPVMYIKFGLNPAIVVSSHEVAREVLQKKDAFFSARQVPDALRAYNHHDVSLFFLPSNSPLWRSYRTICSTNLFTLRRIEATKEIRAKNVQIIMNHFRKKAGQTIHIGEIVFKGILNMVSNLIFSQDVVDLNSETKQELQKLIKESISENLKPNVSDFFPFLRTFDLQGRRRTAGSYNQRFYKFFDNIVDARLDLRNGGKTVGDFLDFLLDLLAESKISRHEIRTLFMELFGAGSDTTSITVEWAMCELLHDPVSMAKATAEVRGALATQTLTEADIANLPYLQAVVKEVLRLHSPGALLPHKAMEDGLDISGYRVPKGTQVLINVWAIARDPQAWNEPDLFMPERFLERQYSFQGRDYEFIPFGSGKRLCPGFPLAMRVVPLMLASMLSEFDWKLPDGMEPKDVDVMDKFASVLELATPLRVVPVPVKN